MVRQALATFGQIDILVNNAGVTRRADIMELTEEDWDRIHRVNAKGVFFCLQRVAREMIPRRSGRIVNIASIAGKGYEGTSNAAYAASKGAVISLTKTAAQQLAKHNINVNSVCPGVTRTALSDDNLRVRAQQEGVTIKDMEHRRVAAIPLKRANDPEDIAAMVVSWRLSGRGISRGSRSTWMEVSSRIRRRADALKWARAGRTTLAAYDNIQSDSARADQATTIYPISLCPRRSGLACALN